MWCSNDNSLKILWFLFLALCGFPFLFPQQQLVGTASRGLKIFRHKQLLQTADITYLKMFSAFITSYKCVTYSLCMCCNASS